METKVTYFQVVDGWLYVLYDNGTIARKYLKDLHNSEWESVGLPEELDNLIEPTQKNAGKKD